MLQRDRATVYSIQALRAVAVSFVVLNHFFHAHLRGGYIGVDIFFVVSGYLITSHLLRELEAGSLSFSRFYLRRARRLLPTALLVLVLTCVAAYLTVPSAWQIANLKDAAAAAIYGVNWLLAANAVNYFADISSASPLNHYWSLSVEEQFYLVWPALLYFSVRIARARTGRTARRLIPAVIGLLMGTVLTVSLVSAVLAVHHSSTVAYFVTYARAWEFAAGGLAGLIAERIKSFLPALSIKVLFIAAWLTVFAWGIFSDRSRGCRGSLQSRLLSRPLSC